MTVESGFFLSFLVNRAAPTDRTPKRSQQQNNSMMHSSPRLIIFHQKKDNQFVGHLVFFAQILCTIWYILYMSCPLENMCNFAFL